MKRRILVVDDDDATRQAAALSLHTMAGWDVVEAYCAAQAIESATQHQPDAILLKPFDPLRLASQVADALGWESETVPS